MSDTANTDPANKDTTDTNSVPANTTVQPATQPATQPAAQPDFSQLLSAIAAMPEQIAKSVSEAVKPPTRQTPVAPVEKLADKTVEDKAKETAAPTHTQTQPGKSKLASWWFG